MMGRDQTIHAAENGYVRYYRDPNVHPTRKYIGVVFDKNGRLPRPIGSSRIRRLGLDPVQPEGLIRQDLQPTILEKVKPRHRRDLVAREPNHLIGRLKNSPDALPVPGKKTKVRTLAHLVQTGKKSKKAAKGKKSAGAKKGPVKGKR